MYYYRYDGGICNIYHAMRLSRGDDRLFVENNTLNTFSETHWNKMTL